MFQQSPKQTWRAITFTRYDGPDLASSRLMAFEWLVTPAITHLIAQLIIATVVPGNNDMVQMPLIHSILILLKHGHKLFNLEALHVNLGI